jgi:hypothetical protein
MGAGWGDRVFGSLSLGIQIHGVQQTIAEKSYSIFTTGFGAMVKTSNGWRLGAAYLNGAITKGSAVVASSFRAGLSKYWGFSKDWTVLTAFSGDLAPQSGNSIQGGLEADYRGKYFIRAGYNHPTQVTGFGGLYGPTMGLGMSLGPVRLDYAFVPYGDMGQSQQFGLVYYFGTYVSDEPDRKEKQIDPPAQPTPAVVAVPVTVYVPAPLPTSSSPSAIPTVVPQAVDNASKAGNGALVMNFEEATEGLPLARQLAKEGHLPEAVKIYVEWIGKNPRDAQAWWELGGVYYQLGHKEYAVKCFETVLQLQPTNKSLEDWLAKYKTAESPPP